MFYDARHGEDCTTRNTVMTRPPQGVAALGNIVCTPCTVLHGALECAHQKLHTRLLQSHPAHGQLQLLTFSNNAFIEHVAMVGNVVAYVCMCSRGTYMQKSNPFIHEARLVWSRARDELD